MKKFCSDLIKHATEIINYEERKRCHWQMKKLSHTIIKNSAISARRTFMMLVIAVTAIMTAMIAMMMISMMKYLMPERLMVILWELIMFLKITMIMRMVVMMIGEIECLILKVSRLCYWTWCYWWRLLWSWWS